MSVSLALANSPADASSRPRTWPVALLLPAALLALWAAADAAGWLNPAILPAPGDVAATLADLWRSGELGEHAARSLSYTRLAGGDGHRDRHAVKTNIPEPLFLRLIIFAAPFRHRRWWWSRAT